jgi:predicted permease
MSPDSLESTRSASWRRYLRFWRANVREDVNQEIGFHLDALIEQGIAAGMAPDEARRAAIERFGDLDRVAGVMRSLAEQRESATRRAEWLHSIGRDVRFALRQLAKRPGFTAVAVLTLALSVGANTAVFSAIDAVLLRPLPLPDAERLVHLRQRQDGRAETNIAPVRLEEWYRLSSTFEAITGYYVEDVSETSGDLPERIRRAWVAPRFHDVWGVAPAMGRGFNAADHEPGATASVLISDRYWRRKFAADPGVVGRTVRLGSTSFPIIGVMPALFFFPDRDVDLWLPRRTNLELTQARHATWYNGIGRLKPGVTLEQARVNLATVQKQLGEQFPDPDSKITPEVVSLKETTVSEIRASLWLLFGAVSVLLLITCTNIAALLLSRAADRQREIAIRLSLGASRSAVVAQVLVETAVLAFIGSAAGLLVAAGASAALRHAGAGLPRMDEVVVDGRILLYTLVTTVMVALLCGVLPSIRMGRGGRGGVSDALSRGARGQVSARNGLQWVLVGAQVAFSVTLLAAAGLLVRSFHELSRVNAGFESSRVLTFRMSGDYAETADRERLVQRIIGTLDALRALPGVAAAASTNRLPGRPSSYESAFVLAEARAETGSHIAAEERAVSPDYFATMRIPILVGEDCGPLRGASTQVLVNRSFVTTYLAGRPAAVGLHLHEGDVSSRPKRIVGIVGDARDSGLDRDPVPTVYSCSSSNPKPFFLVRTRGDPLAIASTVRLTLKEIEPLRSVYDIAPLEEKIGDAFSQNRLRTMVLALFAAAALALACVGLYGTLTYVVSLRRREIGLRMALGGLRSDIIRQFLGQAMRVAGLACVCGLLLSIASTRVLSGMLYGVSPSDPVTLLTVIAIVLAVAALAALLPATRASLVQPMRVLREE